jgi:hypothetical protein
MEDAWNVARNWLKSRPAWIPRPIDRHVEVPERMLLSASVSSNLIPDPHLAALAIEHELTLCSVDTDFSRFSGLRFENPIEI